MPVVGPRVAINVARIGSVGLFTVTNRAGHPVHLTITGDTSGERRLRVSGNDAYRMTMSLGDEGVRVVDEHGSTLYVEPSKE